MISWFQSLLSYPACAAYFEWSRENFPEMPLNLRWSKHRMVATVGDVQLNAELYPQLAGACFQTLHPRLPLRSYQTGVKVCLQMQLVPLHRGGALHVESS
jgi:hypothetical protein